MDDEYKTLRLDNQLCFPLYLCSKEIIRKYTPYLNSLDLTYTQYIVMLYFFQNKTSNVRTLGKTLLLDSSTLTPLLKRLEQKGYIIRKRSKTDERNLNLSITESGEKLIQKAKDIPECIYKQLGINEDESLELYKILYKILINLEKES